MICRVWMAVFVTVLIGIFVPVYAQKNYYVVVGAFSTDGNAEELIARLPNSASDTAYATGDENLVHLYVLKTGDKQTAAEKSQVLQRSIEDLKRADDKYESVTISKLDEENLVVTTNVVASPENTALIDVSASRGSETESTAGGLPPKAKANMFKFTIQDQNGNELPGDIHFVDFSAERDLASYEAFTYNEIAEAAKESEVAIVCGIFGYKEVEKYLDHSNPALVEGAYRDESGAWVIPYELKRLEKGDVSVMYNVAFYKDAVSMAPESKKDLDELVKMMNENPEYEITVHGHCNGKYDRNISLLSDSKNYFSFNSKRRIHGSAKELTQFRAAAIEQYLIDHGISPSRIRTYAWGGRYMLVDQKSNYAKLNDRIEIEIRKD